MEGRKVREFTDLELARIVHGAHVQYNVILGDNAPDPPWDALGGRHQKQIADRVRSIREGKGPAQIHQEWIDEMARWGWKYGEVKDPIARTHPCMRPYDELSPDQQAKDRLAIRIVFTFVMPEVAEEIAHESLRDIPGADENVIREDLPEVCIFHRSFLPCPGSNNNCVISSQEDDVVAVYRELYD